nr:hypothetical protein [Chloroflexia bacterium]
AMYEASAAAAGAPGDGDFGANGADAQSAGGAQPEDEATVEGEFREVGSDR